MKLKKLDIRNLRMFEEASFEFDEKFTLLVGTNGAGKTTLLGALRSCLSTMLFICTKKKYSQRIRFGHNSITYGNEFMNLNLEISSKEATSNLYLDLDVRNSNGNKKSENEGNSTSKKGRWNFQFSNSSPIEEKFREPTTEPICVYFSTDRSIIADSSNRKVSALHGPEAAHVDSLSGKSTHLFDLARWLHAQLDISDEIPLLGVHPDALQEAVKCFLPDCKNLQATAGEHPTFTVEKNGIPLDVKRLSHGERTVLVLVLDIARRLSLANPFLKNPIKDGEGMVLIDEIDLHLHPQWQRDVVQKLCKTFPNCQFVATTHSPQVIGEVEACKIRVIQDGNVSLPVRSYGIDSNRLLADLMGTPPRNREVQEKIRQMSILVDEERNEEALKAIKELEKQLGESDPEITGARTLMSLLEDDT